ncbi:GAF domain-containing sensor histidine kinase [Candidatus Viridilinea mediisalina]|uniref:histidine kinase n=1 Tax=Candidatus Viridilinea mediisalina TaxID=2024553 RepID=A0A2A6RGK4_9CHLR|nr:ATP-binding protein [Candidatus Viridilinea mediisalina]PDW02152.1 histidine kinase [Candidatus Viridilinea mediisalina]
MTERQQTRRRERRNREKQEDLALRRLSDAAETAAAQVTSLLKLSSYLVSVLDPQAILANLIPRLVEVLPSVQAGIIWIDQLGRLRPSATFGLPLTPATAQDLNACQLRAGEGIAGLALQRVESQIMSTTLGYRETAALISPINETLFQHLNEQLPRQVTVAAMPLRVGPETIGVLELINLGTPEIHPPWRPLEQADIPVLQTFANLAASAIKNAQLYDAAQRSARRLKAFDAVVTAISTATDLNDLVQSVLAVVLELVSDASGALLLLDPLYDRLSLAAHRSLPPGGPETLAQLVVTEAPCAEVIHYGQPMQRLLLEERGEGVFLKAGMVECSYLPLLAGGTVAGVLALYGASGLNSRADKDLLMPICNQVGFAIANVRLYADSTSERRKLNTVVTSIAEGVLLCDAHGRLTLANEAALRLLRLDSLPFEQPLTAMPDFYRMRDLDGRPLTLEQLPFTRALAGEIFQDYRLILRGSSGDETVMSFSGAPARSDDDLIEGAVVVFRDITANQKLERAKDEFLAVAAHELRSPLAAVRSYADLLLRREQQRDEGDSRDLHGLTILTQQVSHMLRMVDNLLDVSRIDAGQLDLQMQQINLVHLANQVLDQQRPAAGNRTLQIEASNDELLVTCDTLRIRQVLTNLISNAIKYSPNEGIITVRLNRITESLTENQPPSSSAVVVSVSDEGGGITPDQQARLFQRYYRARNRKAEGLGLGLYLSRQFVQMHGGTIWVESAEGSGSTFAFSLPLSSDDVP